MLSAKVSPLPNANGGTPLAYRRKCTGGTVTLRVVSAQNLAVMDKNMFSKGGSSDPYVKVELHSPLEDKPRAIGKTDVVKKSCNPVFKKAEFTFKVDEELFDLATSPSSKEDGAASDDVPRLVFDIFDKDMMSSDDQMGTATVRLRDMFLDANADPSSTAAPRDGDVADGFRYSNGAVPVEGCAAFEDATGTLEVWATLTGTFKEIEDREKNRAAAAEAEASAAAAEAKAKAAEAEAEAAAAAAEAEAKAAAEEKARAEALAAKIAEAEAKAAAAAAFANLKADWLEHVGRAGADVLSKAEVEVLDDREFILEACQKDGRALNYATDDLMAKLLKDEKFMEEFSNKWLARVKKRGAQQLKTAPQMLRGHRHFIVAACERDVDAIRYAVEELRAALLDDTLFMSNMRTWLKEQWLARVKRDGEKALKKAPASLVADSGFLADSRRILADQYLSLPVEGQNDIRFQKYAKNGELYFGSLNAALVDDTTCLLRADFIIALDESTKPLMHRAEIPKEAFYDGVVWSRVLILALSYMWATRDSPDPDGAQLKSVAAFLRWIKKTPEYRDKTIVVFWDWGSLYQDMPPGSRTEEQTEAHVKSLSSVTLWYTHPHCITLQAMKTPLHRFSAYHDSLWPTFEGAASGLIKSKDVPIVLETVLECKVTPRPIPNPE